MRTIQITEPVLVGGKHYDRGQVVVVDVVTADSITSGGKGVQVPDGTKSEIVNRDAPPENRDPKPLTAAQQKAADKAAKEKAEAEKKAAESTATPPAPTEQAPTE